MTAVLRVCDVAVNSSIPRRTSVGMSAAAGNGADAVTPVQNAHSFGVSTANAERTKNCRVTTRTTFLTAGVTMTAGTLFLNRSSGVRLPDAEREELRKTA